MHHEVPATIFSIRHQQDTQCWRGRGDATEDSAARGENGPGAETSLLPHSEATEAASARTHVDTILERSREAGGNLNLPKLIV